MLDNLIGYVMFNIYNVFNVINVFYQMLSYSISYLLFMNVSLWTIIYGYYFFVFNVSSIEINRLFIIIYYNK